MRIRLENKRRRQYNNNASIHHTFSIACFFSMDQFGVCSIRHRHCPRCPQSPETHGELIPNVSNYGGDIYSEWWKSLKCPVCSCEWYICTQCVTRIHSKHIINMERLHCHYRERHRENKRKRKRDKSNSFKRKPDDEDKEGETDDIEKQKVGCDGG